MLLPLFKEGLPLIRTLDSLRIPGRCCAALIVIVCGARAFAADVFIDRLDGPPGLSWTDGAWADSSKPVRQQARTLLIHRLDQLSEAIELLPGQREKLELAGTGDIVAFAADLIRAQHDWAEAHQKALEEMNEDQQQFVRMRLVVLPPRATGSPFGPSSLFHKTLQGMLTSEQLALLNAAERERQWKTHRLRLVDLLTLLNRTAGLTDEEYQRVKGVLLDGMDPGRGAAEYFAVMNENEFRACLGRIPEEQFEAAVDPSRWALVRVQLRAFREARKVNF